MQQLNSFFRSIATLLHQTWMRLLSIPAAVKHRRVQIALDVAEAERLDRIRNPADYRGK